jgi:hypothetical protein
VVLVSAKTDLSQYGKGIARLLEKFDIGFVGYRKAKGRYIFDGLERILSV